MSALKYYIASQRHYSKLEHTDMEVYVAPVWAEKVLARIGLEGHLRYRLKPKGDWHHYDPNTRTVELAGPMVTALDVLHELAHWWEHRHNGHFTIALELLVQVWEEL